MRSPDRRVRRSDASFTLSSLEPRTLLSAVHPGGGKPPHGSGGPQQVSGQGVTPISDFTAQGLTVDQVVGLPAVQLTDFEGLQRIVMAGQSNLPAVQHLQDLATLTGSSNHVKLRGYSVSIDWGDGTSPSAGSLIVDKSGVVHVKGAHAYAAIGSFTMTITISQTTKNSDGSTTVTNLVVTSTANVTQDSEGGVDVAASTGQPFTGVVGNFSPSHGSDPTKFVAMIDWGDGSASAGTITDNGDGTFAINGTHTYAADGTYRIAIKVFENPPAGVLHANPNNHGLHLGWRHSFETAIFSTATASTVAPPAVP